MKNLRIEDNKIRTHTDTQRKRERERERERERGTENITIFKKMQQLQIITTNLSKGYKVTLYSDSLRATSLYAIYINGPNLGCPRGQCEYVHYTLVFDSRHGCRLRQVVRLRSMVLRAQERVEHYVVLV